MTDILFRASSMDAFNKLGQSLGLLDADDDPLMGVDIDIIGAGQMVHKPAAVNSNGEVTTPAVVDNTNIHVNVRLSGAQVVRDLSMGVDPDGFDTSKIRNSMKSNGVPAVVPSVRRNGISHNWFRQNLGGGDRVELIWPAPVHQRRVWL